MLFGDVELGAGGIIGLITGVTAAISAIFVGIREWEKGRAEKAAVAAKTISDENERKASQALQERKFLELVIQSREQSTLNLLAEEKTMRAEMRAETAAMRKGFEEELQRHHDQTEAREDRITALEVELAAALAQSKEQKPKEVKS